MAGMGWHNAAIENKDDEVEALMVRLLFVIIHSLIAC
jgi:hypothetical protein